MKLRSESARGAICPFALKIVAWLAIGAWASVYAWYHPLENFLWTCNIGLLLTAIGLAADNRLVLSVVLVMVFFPNLGWSLDFVFATFSGRHMIGGTEYMFDQSIPLYVRLFSLQHLLLAPLLLVLLWRNGYDRRALPIAAVSIFVLYYLTYFGAAPELQVNWVYGLFGKPQAFVVAPAYPFVAALLFFVVLMLPTHFLARRYLPSGGADTLNSTLGQSH